jgi:hypothetical protein
MLNDEDEFTNHTLESRMAGRAHAYRIYLGLGYWKFVAKLLKNTAFRIDRDLVALGLLLPESEK